MAKQVPPQVEMQSSSQPPANAPPTNILPKFHLLCIDSRAVKAWNAAVTEHFPDLTRHTNVEIHECSLKYLEPSLRFDAVVSPANCYARLDGAYDDALARAFKPKNGGSYDWITEKAQAVLYEKYRGYVPPGTCTIVPLDHDMPGDASLRNPWGTSYLLLCPTMRIPWDVRWDREVVYECIWTMLCAVDGHNRQIRQMGGAGEPIKSILMTPLATGCGMVSYERWAEQTVLAMKYFVEAVEKPEVWSRMTWENVFQKQVELNATWEDDCECN